MGCLQLWTLYLGRSGDMMGVTRERIRQIEAKALKKLQHKKEKRPA